VHAGGSDAGNPQSAIRNPKSEPLLWESYEDAEHIVRYDRDIEFLYSDIWLPFERRAKVLDHFGYLDFNSETVTEAGKWLADVRVDRPLLVGEALRRGIFDELTPPIAAGLMASLAADSDRNYGELYLSDDLLDVISRLEEIILEVSNKEWNSGIEPTEEINLSAAAAAERWAGGMTWDQLASKTGAEEGDLFRLLARTGEALLQIANLRESHSKAAAVARSTAEVLLREPVR
jgi:ATP-dependent RNA helicase HelY